MRGQHRIGEISFLTSYICNIPSIVYFLCNALQFTIGVITCFPYLCFQSSIRFRDYLSPLTLFVPDPRERKFTIRNTYSAGPSAAKPPEVDMSFDLVNYISCTGHLHRVSENQSTYLGITGTPC